VQACPLAGAGVQQQRPWGEKLHDEERVVLDRLVKVVGGDDEHIAARHQRRAEQHEAQHCAEAGHLREQVRDSKASRARVAETYPGVVVQ